ncbi:MAG: hypothetical protein OK436_06855, partial [Thaumarchaeota archaeon]|nr:hypothetical protein [Nitrososphaerota archaeon]
LLYRQRELVQLINPADFGLPAGIKELHPAEIRDAISATFPEVGAYVSTVTSPGGLTTPYLEPTAFRFNEDLKTGRIKYLSTPEILDKVDQFINVRDGYLEYTRQHNLYNQSLIYYGVSSSSTTGKALNHAIMDPVMRDLSLTNKDWTDHFDLIRSNSAAGLKTKSADIMTLASWEVLPHFDDPTVSTPEALKTQNSWRQLLSDRSELSAYLRQITAQGATAQDKQQVIFLFRKRVDMIAAADPGFAAMIKNFSISNMDEFLKVGAA